MPCLAALSPGVPIRVKVVVLMLAVCSAVVTWRHHRRCANDWLELQTSGAACVVRAEQADGIDILSGCVDLGWVIVVHWRRTADGKAVRHAFARDGMDVALWRQLRIWLRWKARRPTGKPE
ncbi:MAG: hypothetical protein QM803_13905 [Rhodocyclaceae bacterium]